MKLIHFYSIYFTKQFFKGLNNFIFFQKWNCVVVLDSRDLTKLFFFSKVKLCSRSWFKGLNQINFFFQKSNTNTACLVSN